MAAEKFTFFISFYEALKELPPEDFKKVIIAICEYAFYDKEPDLPLNLIVPFRLIKPIIDKTLKISEIRAEQGKKGGAPVGNTNASKQANSTKNKQKQADKDKEKDKEKNKGRREMDISADSTTPLHSNSFQKPTLLEIKAFCEEQNYRVNPEEFFNFYECNGWMVGQNPMKDWKASVSTWESRKKNDSDSSKNSFGQCMSNGYTKSEMDELEKKLLDN